MYINVSNNENLKKVNSKVFKKKTIILIYSHSCGPCQIFLDTWSKFTDIMNKTNRSYDLIAIETSCLAKITNKQLHITTSNMMKKNPFVPNIAKVFYNTHNRLYMFNNNDRSLSSLKSFV